MDIAIAYLYLAVIIGLLETEMVYLTRVLLDDVLPLFGKQSVYVFFVVYVVSCRTSGGEQRAASMNFLGCCAYEKKLIIC